MPGSIRSAILTSSSRATGSGFRPRRSKLLLISLAFSLIGLASCRADEVLGIPGSEAAKRLKIGDYGFVLAAPSERLGELSRLDPNAAFYIAAKLAARPESADRAESLLSQAIASGSPLVKKEASRFLFEILLTPKERGGEVERGRYQRALVIAKQLVAETPSADKDPRARLAALLLALESGTGREALTAALLNGPLGDDERLLFELARRKGDLPSQTVLAFKAREAIERRSYQEAHRFFLALLAGGDEVFFTWPEMISDLGKAFQFGGAPKEGAALLEKWAQRPDSGLGGQRYRCLFYAARMKWALADGAKGKAAEALENSAAELWKEALKAAPTAEQSDACLWYLLDMAMEHSDGEVLTSFGQLYPLWQDPDKVDDLVETLGARLVGNRNWKGFIDFWGIVRTRCDATARARYSYIIGRLLDLGYIDAAAAEPFAPAVTETSLSRRFYRASFDADVSSLYYRCLSASWLDGGLDPVPAEGPGLESKPAGKEQKHPEALTFIRGFIDFGCADIAAQWIHRYTSDLNPGEVKQLGAWLTEAGRWGDSIRFVSRLQWMDGYRLTKDDLRLIYPLAYSTEIETAAGRWNLPFELFYGLVRTESAFIPDISSNVGAIGLAQLMPATARDVARKLGREVKLSWDGDVPDLRDPETNAELGAYFLSDQSKRLGSPMLALLAYNGGPTRVRRWRAAAPTLPEDLFLESIPIDETRNYGKKVLAAAAVYGYLYSGRPLEAVVADILPHLR